MTPKEKSILALLFPEGVFEWFELEEGRKDENNIYLVFKEKNIPPIPEKDKNKKIEAKGFNDITITDFPIRGRRTHLTFKRRYWQVEGRQEYLKRDIQLSFPGTQLETEFAAFLKEDGGRECDSAHDYRKIPADPRQPI